jgi:SOS-response transcriptional repressor LexA
MSDIDEGAGLAKAEPDSKETRLTLEARVRDSVDSTDEPEQAEREKDVLVELVGRRIEAALDTPLNRDSRFLEWRSRELRESTAYDGIAPDRMKSIRERVLSRVLAHRMGIRTAVGAPELQRPSVIASAQNAIAEASKQGCAPRVELAVAAGTGREIWDEPCTDWVKVPAALPSGNYVAIDVKGASMEPLLHSGDLILVRPDPVPKPNMVVVARDQDGGYVVKSVRRVSRYVIELASLNPLFPDIRVPHANGSIIGRVVARWCQHM